MKRGSYSPSHVSYIEGNSSHPHKSKWHNNLILSSKNIHIMKQTIIAFAALTFAACSNSHTETTTTTDSPGVTTTTTTSNTTISTAYTPAEGDVTYRDGKVKVYKGSTWVDTDNDVVLETTW